MALPFPKKREGEIVKSTDDSFMADMTLISPELGKAYYKKQVRSEGMDGEFLLVLSILSVSILFTCQSVSISFSISKTPTVHIYPQASHFQIGLTDPTLRFASAYLSQKLEKVTKLRIPCFSLKFSCVIKYDKEIKSPSSSCLFVVLKFNNMHQ